MKKICQSLRSACTFRRRKSEESRPVDLDVIPQNEKRHSQSYDPPSDKMGLFQGLECVANQTLTASPQPAVTTTTTTTTASTAVEEPAFTMSPPTEDEANLVLTLATDAANTAAAPNSNASPTIATTPMTTPVLAVVPHKRSHKDFIFGTVIGEGSFSTVYLAKDIHTNKEYAIKVCEKRHIIREKKTKYVRREKEVLNMLAGAKHSFVRLFCTFQDLDRLYFVLSYAKNGELLPYINKVGSFDIECTKFYSAEILRALEYLHGLGIIHRDLKPENILLDENMHILITDFGSAKILKDDPEEESRKAAAAAVVADRESSEQDSCHESRRNSFVGTAQYVSPELLTDRITTRVSDLWALGCIIYQMVSGLPPFRSRSEYLIFRMIMKLQYEIPDGFCELARDLVVKLLVLDPNQRLGATDEHGAGYPSIRAHPFFANVDFETLHEQTPPPIYPYLPGTSENEELRSHYRVPNNLEPGLDDKQLTRLLGLGIGEPSDEDEDDESSITEQQQQQQRQEEEEQRRRERREKQSRFKLEKPKTKPGVMDFSKEEFERRLEEQEANNKWHKYVQGNLIIKEGYVNKRKGLFTRRRMLLLTTGPHLYYIDTGNNILKGEIPWSKELRVEPKNFKIFFVHTPNRTYYLEDPEGFALQWCQAIEETRVHYFGAKEP